MSETTLPWIAKGILTGDDAEAAAAAGASAVLVSNHGGRQLDGAPAASLISCRMWPPRSAGGSRSGSTAGCAAVRRS